jgi:hypothetical protein
MCSWVFMANVSLGNCNVITFRSISFSIDSKISQFVNRTKCYCTKNVEDNEIFQHFIYWQKSLLLNTYTPFSPISDSNFRFFVKIMYIMLHQQEANSMWWALEVFHKLLWGRISETRSSSRLFWRKMEVRNNYGFSFV